VLLDPALSVLCDRCLGRRLVGARGIEEQQATAREERTGSGWPDVAEADCPVCEGAFGDLPVWLDVAYEAMASYEAATFQVGTAFPSECEALEKRLMRLVPGENTESVRTEANRLLSAALAERTGKEPTPDGRADVVVVVDTRFWHADVRANSVFVRGRYTKHRRDIPQTHWPCKRCQGHGCYDCGGAGVLYHESVEDAVADEARPRFGAAGASFHGAGREDIDALMLGNGRPFILELHDPRRRFVDLAALMEAVNGATRKTGVGVQDLRMAEKDEVAAIKAGEYDKEYLAHCVSEAPVARAAVEAACAALSGTTLDQRTPERVSHRRADLVRRRTVHHTVLERMDAEPGERFSVRVLAESGTYIKEMVSGDDGRTTPSLAALLAVPCRVEALDVVRVVDAS